MKENELTCIPDENASSQCQGNEIRTFNPAGSDDPFIMRVQSIHRLVSQNTEIVNRTLDLANQVTDVYRESQQLTAKVEAIKEYSKVELARTAAKFQLTKSVIEGIFGERKEALDNCYKVLDKAINEGNDDMIIKSMQMIGSVVVTSPLGQIQDFIKAFENKDQPLLDF